MALAYGVRPEAVQRATGAVGHDATTPRRRDDATLTLTTLRRWDPEAEATRTL